MAAGYEEHLLWSAIRGLKPEETTRGLMLVDISRVRQQFNRWRRELPMVKPFYAVKSNNDPAILREVAQQDGCFDCASPEEMQLVVQTLKPLSPQDRIIYSNPCKHPVSLRLAERLGVEQTVADSNEELIKIKKTTPEVKIFLRIATEDTTAQCPLSQKYGAHREDWKSLLSTAKELNLNLIGVHFHVGSGCRSLGAFAAAIKDAQDLFSMAALFDFNFHALNIGGGFPGSLLEPGNTGCNSSSCDSDLSFEQLALEIRNSLEKYNFLSNKIVLSSEPGRFFAAASCTLAVQIHSRRILRNNTINYFINDSVYGTFSNVIFDHAKVVPKSFKKSEKKQLQTSTIFGQTCDGIDCVSEDALLPLLKSGEWLYFPEMGAYTLCSASTFNGFELPTCIYHYDNNANPESTQSHDSDDSDSTKDSP